MYIILLILKYLGYIPLNDFLLREDDFMKYYITLLLGLVLLLSACGVNNEGTDEPEGDEAATAEEDSETNTSENNGAEMSEEDSEPIEADIVEEGENSETSADVPESTLEGTEALIPSTEDIEFDTRGSSYLDLVTEDTFTNEIGYGAFEDYVDITEEYTLSNYTAPDGEGSTPEEIDQMMKDDLDKNEADFSDTIHMVVYRYPDEEMYNEEMNEPGMMAEISFIFEDDQLIFSSITPGYYEVDVSDLDDIETIGEFTDMEEVTDLNPEIFTIAEINHHGYIFQQVMLSASPMDDYPDSPATAAYIIFLGDDVMQMIGYPFMEASQDFPTYSYAIYNTFIENLAALEAQ